MYVNATFGKYIFVNNMHIYIFTHGYREIYLHLLERGLPGLSEQKASLFTIICSGSHGELELWQALLDHRS